MRKLLIISIVLVAAGLGLVLYADPVILQASGGSPPGGAQINVTSISGGGPPGNCHVANGVTICSGGPGGQILSDTNGVIETIAGIGLCGVGLFLTAIESISKSQSPLQTKAVT